MDNSQWIIKYLPSNAKCTIGNSRTGHDPPNEQEIDLSAKIADSYRLTPSTWKHWDPDVQFIQVRAGRTLELMKIYSMRDFRNRDLEEFEDIVLPVQKALDAGLNFMKLSNRSTKSGEFGLRPIRTPLEALESIGSLKPFELEYSDQIEYIIFCHWRQIDREYRVFWRNNKIEAISQQKCHDIIPDMKNHALVDAEKISIFLSSQKIYYEESAIDIGITNGVPWIIEWNPPTLWCNSGSSLLTEDELIRLRKANDQQKIPILIRS